MVIMDVDSYEALVDTQMRVFDRMVEDHAPVPMDKEIDLLEDYEEIESINPFSSPEPEEIQEEGLSSDNIDVDLEQERPGIHSGLAKDWISTGDILKDKIPAQDEVVIEDLPYDVPFKAVEDVGELNEEKLDENPVFLEEPL